MKKIIPIICMLFLFSSTLKAQLFHEDFENPDSVVSFGNIGFHQSSMYHTNGMYCDSATYLAQDSSTLITLSFSTIGPDSVYLSFDQIAKVEFFDACIIEYSLDSVNWIKLYDTPGQGNCTYYGGSPGFISQGCKFTEASYSDWQAGQNTQPDSTWWKHEVFNLSQLAGNQPINYIRFKIIDLNNTGAQGHYGWLIDNLIIDNKYSTSSTWVHGDTCITPTIYHFDLSYYAVGYNLTDSSKFIFDFDDGTFDSISFPINNSFFKSIGHMYSFSGTYYPSIVSIIPGVLTDTSFYTIKIGNGCDTINGRVYFDNNSDCIFNLGDSGRTNHWMVLKTGSLYYQISKTDSVGYYQFVVPNSNYTVFNNLYNGGILPICPLVDTIAISSVPSFNNDFAISCNSFQDFAGTIFHTGLSPAHIARFEIYYRNLACQGYPGQIKLIIGNGIDSLLYCYGCTISGDTAIWNASFNFNSNFRRSYFRVDSNLTIGDTICYQLLLDPISTDSNPANNFISYCTVFSAPWDPNFKQVSPDGDIPNNTELNYTIHFQNTGTASAINAIVVDTFSNNVDINTLQILSSSHPMNLIVDQNKVAQFIFPNIILPDSGSDLEGSQGYIMYSIKTKSNLTAGTKIFNSADIYFDNNAPVKTNTTENTIIIPLAVNEITSDENSVTVFPNPFENNFKVKSKQKINAVEITDITGKIVYTSKYASVNESNISCGFLSKGIYILKVNTDRKSYCLKLVK